MKICSHLSYSKALTGISQTIQAFLTPIHPQPRTRALTVPGFWVPDALPLSFFFYSLGWYKQRLLDHGDRVLSAAKSVFGSRVALGGKIAGIHWYIKSFSFQFLICRQYKHPSHAAEVTAGYVNVNQDGYDDVPSIFLFLFLILKFAALFAKYDATFIFTALEMRDSEQQGCNCGPSELVS